MTSHDHSTSSRYDPRDALDTETSELNGRTFTLLDGRGTRIAHTFASGSVTWDYAPGDADPTPAETQTDPCAVFWLDEELYVAHFRHVTRPRESVALFLDLASGTAFAILSVLPGADSDSSRITQLSAPAHILEFAPDETIDVDGVDQTQRSAFDTPESAAGDVVGIRELWEWSDDRVTEVLAVNERSIVEHTLAGPQRGDVAVHEITAWQLRTGISVFAWTDERTGTGTVLVADRRTARGRVAIAATFGSARIENAGTAKHAGTARHAGTAENASTADETGTATGAKTTKHAGAEAVATIDYAVTAARGTLLSFTSYPTEYASNLAATAGTQS